MTTDEIKQKVIDYANGYGIDPAIALAQIGRESSFNPNAVGALGERGLGQFTAATWSSYGYGPFDNAFDVDYNLTAWGAYMTYLLNLFGWDIQKALTAYNGGPGHLTNPEKYGGPSAAALAYAQAIYSQAGVTADSAVNLDQSGASPNNLPIWLLIGGLAVVAFVALRD